MSSSNDDILASQLSDSQQFDNITMKDAATDLQQILDHIVSTENDQTQKRIVQRNMHNFQHLLNRHLNEKATRHESVAWNQIQALPETLTKHYRHIETTKTTRNENVANMLNKLIVIKLNGGLGTSMGCQGPKSTINVRNELSFLDLTVQQVLHLNRTYNVNVPLLLMNSFNTDAQTQQTIRKYEHLGVTIHTFNQSCYPRVYKESFLPLATNARTADNLNAWYPPGHGDFYESFAHSGLLDTFLEQGFQYCFVSNIDNLGATVDVNILNLLTDERAPRTDFIMEITEKTRADIKGGTLVQYENKVRLLELAQVAKQHVDEFKSIKKFKYFNTNNLWIKLDAIRNVLDDGFELDIIVNQKTIDGGSTHVIQLETAIGAAIHRFNGSIGLNVPRARFLPVKTTSDLLLIMSNLYTLKHGTLTLNPDRSFFTMPFVKLGEHFTKVKDFLDRFATIPDLLQLDHLTVSGDVTFEKNVTLRGTVIIIAEEVNRIDVPANAVLENKIVSGSLRILDH